MSLCLMSGIIRGIPEVRNIQRHKAKLNITLRRMNNFDIKQKVVCNIYFTICSKHPTKSR